MQEAESHKTQPDKEVAAFTVEHGVNPGWGVHEERPVIPDFTGVAEIGKLAMLLTLWGRVEEYLYSEVGIEPLVSAKEEKKHLAVLLESETFLVALLCLLNNEHYSASALVDAMVGVSASADQRGNARKRILNRTLPIVGDHYGLLDYSERHMGNSMEYSICRSQRLVHFAEANLVTGINDILGIESSPFKKSSVAKKTIKKAPAVVAVKKQATKKQAVKKQASDELYAKERSAKERSAKKTAIKKTASKKKTMSKQASSKQTNKKKTVSKKPVTTKAASESGGVQ